MHKSASLGDEYCQELLNQNSLSQMINPNYHGDGSKFSSNKSQPVPSLGKIVSASHTRNSSQVLLESESSKEIAKHLQPNSFQPSHSHSLLNSQRQLELLDENQDLEKGIGAREGARTRSRLFFENKDLIQPKSGISQEEIPAAETETKTIQQKLGPTRLVNQNSEKKDPPSLLAVYDMKPRVSQISSQSMTSAVAFKQYLIKEANNMLHTQQPSTHTIGGSNLINTHHLGSGLVNTVSQRRSIGIFTSQYPASTQSPMLAAPSVKVFINILRFASEMKRKLRFSRPLELSATQLDIINDASFQTHDEIHENSVLTKKEIANATRSWIHAPRNMRQIKKMLKPFYISALKASFNLSELFRKYCLACIPSIAADGMFNITREALMVVVNVLNFIVVPLDCAFEGMTTTQDIKTVSALVCFINIIVLCFTQYFELGCRVSDSKSVVLNYLRNKFLLDLITAISLLISAQPLVSLLFFLRIIYDTPVTTYARKALIAYNQATSIVNLVMPFLIAFFHCHFIACAWIYTVSQESSSTWMQQLTLNHQPRSDIYLKSLFLSAQLVTNASSYDWQSWSNTEIVFLVIASIYTCCLLAYIFSAVHQALKDFTRQNTTYLKGLAHIEKFMDAHDISRSMRVEMREEFSYLHFANKDIDDHNHHSRHYSLHSQLTKQLIDRMSFEIFSNLYSQNIILKEYFDNEDLMKILASKTKEHSFSPGQIIIKQNSLQIPCLHFIVQGSVDILIERNDVNSTTSVVQHLTKNQSFGELEFFSQSFQTCLSVRANGFTKILSIALSDFHDAVQQFPYEKEAICYLKDCILLNNDYAPIGLCCLSCKSSRHSIVQCPFLSFQKSTEKALRNLDQEITKQIAAFKRSRKRTKFPSILLANQTFEHIATFTNNNEDLMNTSLYEEYLDEVDSEKQSFFKQATAPALADEKSTYTRKTSKKASLKQTQTIEELSFQRKNSKNATQKLLAPTVEEIHEKSQISRVSQFSNRQSMRMDIEEKKLNQISSNQIPSDYEIGQQNRKRTHSGLSQIIGSRKSPFPSERDWNRSYSGSLISSLRLSEADRKALNLDDRNVLESSKLVPTTTPNLFVIKINEGQWEDSSSAGHHKGQYYSNAGSSIFAPNNIDGYDSQIRRNSTSYSMYSRNLLMSSQFPAHEEFSELRLDQATNRGRESSFYQLEYEHPHMPALSLDNTSPLMTNQGNFEEQQNFKMYFAHNNLQNVISQPAPDSKNMMTINKQKRPKQSRYLRVISVNNRASKNASTPTKPKIHKYSISHPEQIPALLPYKQIVDGK